MANKYVYSGAAGAGTGADWTNAYTSLAAAATGAAAGDDIWVAHDHAESLAAAQTATFAGSSTAPNRIICALRTGSVPPVPADWRTTAVVTTTGANGITINGAFYMYGVTFNAGTGASAANISLSSAARHQVYEACAFNLVTSAASSQIISASGSGAKIEWANTTASFGATGQGITASSASTFIWRDKPGSTAITGSTIPTTLFTGATPNTRIELRGLDLSALVSGKTIFGAPGADARIINCKLDSAVAIATTPANPSAGGAKVLGSHSSGNVQRNEWYQFHGNLTTETTIIRTGGASDGTTAYSWKLVSNANNKRAHPMETFEGVIWNTDLSSKTLTVHTVTDNVTLTDGEIWLEVDYLASSATPVSTLITDANATIMTTAANQASSSETWTTTGLTTPLKQKLEVTFTPAMIGAIRWRVKYAKASGTVYVCPKAELS